MMCLTKEALEELAEIRSGIESGAPLTAFGYQAASWIKRHGLAVDILWQKSQDSK